MSELIKRFEGFKARPYLDAAGIPTIGYGTIRYMDNTCVKMSDPSISETVAEELLNDFVNKYVKPVIRECVTIPLNVNQKNALESFIYNIGSASFKRSTLLKKINDERFDEAADEFLKWNKITKNGKKVICKGLCKRREAERSLFLQPAFKNSINKLDKPIKKDNIFIRSFKLLTKRRQK